MEIEKGKVLDIGEIEELEKSGYDVTVGEDEKMDIETERELQKSAGKEMEIKYRIESVEEEKIAVEREFL